ncbi:MAG: polysaccharide deacetylase family protein [Cyclobacteriaceae bacterium]
MRKFSFFFTGLLLTISFTHSQPKISFTFDDGITRDHVGYTFEEWNQLLLDKLNAKGVQSTFFVTGSNKTDKKGKYLLKSWDNAGHSIANHTYSHPNFNSKNISSENFREELIGADTIIRQYRNYKKLFRFPYLKEGDTPSKVAEIRSILRELEYQNGYVTIDASDWYIDSRLRKRLDENPNADIEVFKEFYLAHLLERANFYENLSFQLEGRHIRHTLLLHHNLAAALFFDDLVDMFRKEGWEIVSSTEAYTDPVYKKQTSYAGESLIWALARDSGRFEKMLRYPAEDSRYEKEKMDALGL